MENAVSFGLIVRERRSGMGLTQAELARRAGCAAITIRKIESDSLRPSVQLAELLTIALNIPLKEQTAFIQLARKEKPPTPIPQPTPSPTEIGKEDLSGRAVKGFQLAERIGSGGFGIVYRAVQTSVERNVAIKIIMPRIANHPSFIRRFEAEAQLIAQLEHPHIVPLYDFWREPSAAYLVMRYLHGGSLEGFLKTNGPLSIPQFRRMARQIGRAIAAAHARGIIHRDIKPANILLDEDDNAYLADFGIANNLELDQTLPLAEKSALITAPQYVPPELVEGKPLRPSSDIYSFGLLLFEMISGRKAFDGPTPLANLQQQLYSPTPALTDLVANLPVGVDALIQKATSKQPDDRFPSVDAMLQALDALPRHERTSTQPLEQKTAVSLSPNQIQRLKNPFRGLHPFGEADSGTFFGRDALVLDLLGMLSDDTDLERFVAIVGPSGSGKSSVAKAGILPALRRGGLPNSENWFIIDMTPGSNPWAEFTTALRRVAINLPTEEQPQSLEANDTLLKLVDSVLPDDAETELVLLIDQFEELFTLVEDEGVRGRFLENLVTAVLDSDSRLRLIITLRADFIDQPLQYLDFGELLRQRLMLLLPLSVEQLTQVITKPIEQLGMQMTPDLVATIINDVGDQPGTLPLLQYALTELFEERQGVTLTLEAYKATGGVTGALAHRADQLYNDLDDAQQEATRQLFLRLITLGEGVEDTRRRVLLTELESLGAQDDIIQTFGRYRLLTFDHDPETRSPTVEVAHEALLREWPRLRQWLREVRDDVRRQRQLAEATRLWDENGRDDSYLLHGSRLHTFAAWVETSSVKLTQDEDAYLQASISASEARRAAEEARRQRELETVQKLAREQTKRAEEQAKAATSLRRRAVWLAGALAVAAVLAIVATLFGRDATLSEREAVESYSLSLAANARQALDADDQPLALLLALAANSVDQPPPIAQQTLVDIAYAPGVNRQFMHDSPINGLAVRADGRFLITGSDDGLVLLWDADSGAVVQRLEGHSAAVHSVAFSPDGTEALSGANDDTIIHWDLQSGTMIQTLVGHRGDVSSIHFTPDGQYAVSSEDTAAAPSDLIVWELATGQMVRRFGGTAEGNSEGTLDMALSRDGRYALTGQYSYADTNPQPTLLWDVTTGQSVQAFTAHSLTVSGVALGPDGRSALAGSEDGFLYQWNLESGEQHQRLAGHEGPVIAVAYNADGRHALSSSLDRTMIWWDLESGEMIRRFLYTGVGELRTLHFLDDGHAITASTDGTVQVWDLSSNWQLERWGADGNGHQPLTPNLENRGMALAISPDGRFAASGGNFPDHDLILWEYESGEMLHKLSGHEGSIYAVTFSPDSTQVLTASQDGTLILWNVETGEMIRQLEGHRGLVNGVDMSEDGRTAVSASLSGAIGVWDLQTGQLLHRIYGHFDGRGAYDVTFLPGDQYAISSSWDGSLVIYDVMAGEQVERLTGVDDDAGGHFPSDGDQGVHGISLHPNNGTLLSAGRDDALLLWDVQNGRSLRRLLGHAGEVVDVAFSPDGRTAVSTAVNDFIIVWDVASGTPLRRLPINNRMDSSFRPTLAIHPDGQTFLSSEPDGTLIKWQLTTPEPAALVTWLQSNRHIREMGCAERETYGVEPLCVDGVAQGTVADLVTAVAQTAPVPIAQPASQEVVSFSWEAVAGQMVGTAVMGQNRGELTSNHFDIWTYEGKKGEILQFQVLADSPLTDTTLSLQDLPASGMLDSSLVVLSPDGTLLTRGSDGVGEDGQFLSDANIEAFQLPEDGLYRIEARSYLDRGAGAYTLQISSRVYEVDEAVLQAYVGHYLEGPWEYDIYQRFEDGRFYQEAIQSGAVYDLIPISDTQFIDTDGSIVEFVWDEEENVVGYRIWISLLHPIGGQWYEAEKLDD